MPPRPIWLFFLATLLVAALHLSWSYNQLPAEVATHFNASGEADGWSSRNGFAITYIVLIAAMAGIFAGLVFLLPRLPVSTISLPNRDYWLAPERREATWRRLGEFLLLIGGGTNLFNVMVMHLTVQANRQPEVQLSGWFWLLFTAFMVFVFAWVGWLLWSFRVPRR